ncbi:MAG: Fe-S cluster assembly ATPase SufC [Candidatus Marinimicrobia bacterium]|nr:Fe-S cluster assembly ATPase SufC [Candidatus Neomarinimicrobiota bacterium]
MLRIINLHVSVEGKEILKGIDLQINQGELHAIMGPNGSGKSTLAQVLAGREDYEITAGSFTYQGEDIIDLPPEERARRGMFLSFQYPVVIPGVNNIYLLQAAVNAVRKYRGEEELDAVDFLAMIKSKVKSVDLDNSFLYRPVNEGFSGGEKKRNEILQMLALEPAFTILDETDSGLDIDALKIVAEGVNNFRSPDRSFLVITHYQRLLDYMEPDYVHVLSEGRIVKSGGPELASELEQRGYGWLRERAGENGSTVESA